MLGHTFVALTKKKNYDTTNSICLFINCDRLADSSYVFAGAFVFKPLGVTLASDAFQSTWGLFGILFLSTVVAFCTIFLFRNRMLQVRMTVFNSILLIGYYAAFFVFMFMLKDDLEAMSFQLGWALCLPAISIVLNYLSFRAIYRDEVMVKAADSFRLRK